MRRVGGEAVLDIRDEQGLTPLMHACLYGNVDNVALLLKRKVLETLKVENLITAKI